MTTRRRFLRDVGVVSVAAAAGCLEDIEAPVEQGEDDAGADAGDVSVDEEIERHERSIHDRVNAVREEHDRETLEFNDAIAQVARRHSRDMVEREYFSHESPDGEGPQERMSDFFPEHCREIGENLANVGRPPGADADVLAEIVISGWLDSLSHRENLLRGSSDEQGIGVAFDGDDRIIATQKLCTTHGFGS